MPSLSRIQQPSIDASAQFMGFKNRIINGAMMIDQRNAGASVTASTTGSLVYTLDRFFYYADQSSKFTVQQNAGSVTPPAGFTNYLGVTSSSAYSVGSTEAFGVGQNIEGLNVSDFGWGTANAQPVTFSFWVRSSLTGAFGGSLRNSSSNRSYPFSYTINSANTWEQKTVKIDGDTSGTWLTTNAIGIRLWFSIGCGSTYNGTVNTWAGANFLQASGATSVVGTSGATFYITGVQLEKGSTATSFDYRPYGTELALCQRYYEFGTAFSGPSGTTNGATLTMSYAVQKRATPTLTITPTTSWTGGAAGTASMGSGIWNTDRVIGFYNSSGTFVGAYWYASAEL